MNSEIIEKAGRWSTLTRSEANYFIKSDLISKIFDMTPYVKSKLYSIHKLKNNNDKCDFAIELRGLRPLSSFDSQLACHPSYKNGIYKKSFLYKLKYYDKEFTGIVPVIRIDENAHIDFDSLGELDTIINARIIKYGRFMYEKQDINFSKTLENAYQEYFKNYKSIYQHPNYDDTIDYEEFLYNGEVYGRHSSDDWAKMKDLEWIVDSKHRILVSRNIIDVLDEDYRLFAIKQQSTLGKVELIITGTYKGNNPDKKEFSVVSQENIMSKIIKNKYGISDEKHLERELKR